MQVIKKASNQIFGMIKYLIVLCVLIHSTAIYAQNHIQNVQTTQVFTITAYCGCVKCCGKWSAAHKTADGHTPKEGITCAASRSIPFRTKLSIDTVGTRIVQDRLAQKYDNRIDIYFEKHTEALKFGKKRLAVKVIK